MIDTHAHLNASRFKKSREEAVLAARTAGVVAMIVPGTDMKDSRLAVELAHQYEGVYAAVGVHPNDATEEIDWTELERLLGQPKVVAVGEIGLDSHYQGGITAVQIQTFERQLQLAVKHQKPVIIHSREATDQLLTSLEKYWDSTLQGKMVFHCCEADARLLAFATAHQLYIGIDGDITYGPEKVDFISRVPLEMLLLETDSPYLLPEPLRGEKKYPNTPANLPLIAQAVAEARNEPLEHTIDVTTANARRLFNI